MFITIDSNNNILRANCPIKMDDNQIEVKEWPEKSPDQPYRKSEVLWDGSKVVLKTQAQLDSDAASKALPATDAKMPRALEDLIEVLLTKNTFRKNEMPVAVQELYDLKKELRSKILP